MIDAKEYMIKGRIPDFDKFRRLARNASKLMLKAATKTRKEFTKEKQKYYDTLESVTFQINDFVAYQPRDTINNKYNINELYGFIVTKILIPGKKYEITNVYDKSIKFCVEAIHIRHIHRPLWLHVEDCMEGSLLRMDRLKTKPTDERADMKRLKSIKSKK